MELLDLALDAFPCPRCGSAVQERFYGPCASCREQLGALRAARSGDVATPTAFVPKMHVVPNQIATKE